MGSEIPPSTQGKGSGALSFSSCFLKQKLLSLPGHCGSEGTLERRPWNGMEKDGVVPTSLALPRRQREQTGQGGDRGIVTLGNRESLFLLFPLGADG